MHDNILIIGTYFDNFVDSYRWWSELPNLSDYKTIILDPTRMIHDWLYSGRVKQFSRNRYILSDINEQDNKIQTNMRLVKRKLIEILCFDIDVYVLYAPTITIDHIAEIGNYAVSSGMREAIKFVATNDWCPISFETHIEKGKIIHIKDDSFKQYFKDFKEWDYYFISDSLTIEELEQYYAKIWKVTGNVVDIAVNNVDKPIAVEFYPSFHNWSAKEKRGYFAGASKIGGRLILLPIIDSYDTKPHIESLLHRIGLYTETPPPSWVSSIEILGEAQLKSDIEAKKRQLDVFMSEIKEKENSLGELQKFKGLLYETGLTLQELVESTFNEIGINIEPSPVSDEFIINVGGRKALVEVKGNTKSITKGDLGQLITDLGEYLKVAGEDIYGILIGNAWRLEPLEVRDKHDTPIFSQTVINIAENRNIGLLSTTELFKAYCKVLEDPTCKKEILNKIIGSKGVINF